MTVDDDGDDRRSRCGRLECGGGGVEVPIRGQGHNIGALIPTGGSTHTKLGPHPLPLAIIIGSLCNRAV